MGQPVTYCQISCSNGCYVNRTLEENLEVRLIRKGGVSSALSGAASGSASGYHVAGGQQLQGFGEGMVPAPRKRARRSKRSLKNGGT